MQVRLTGTSPELVTGYARRGVNLGTRPSGGLFAFQKVALVLSQVLESEPFGVVRSPARSSIRFNSSRA